MKRWQWATVVTVSALGAWVNRNDTWYNLLFWSGIYALLAFAFSKLLIVQEPEPRPPQREWKSALRSRCYLVVHLDLKVSPPVALFVHMYSCSAKDLTMTGAREARADLYMVEADTFSEALDEMERLQPLYFPWATEWMVRK